MIRRLLTRSPWPLCCVVLLPFVLWTSWVQDRGMQADLVDRGLLEYWVHGLFEAWSWVPFIHPPLYPSFMNATDFYAGWFDVDVASVMIGHAALAQCLLVVFVAWFFSKNFGAPCASLAAALVAFSPNWVRPFENYPLGTTLCGLATIACLGLARTGSWSSMAVAIFAVLAAVELHLSNWFAIGGLMAGLFFLVPGRRKTAFVASISMIALFLLTTYPGLYQVLAEGPDADADATRGSVTMEWTNPLLYVPLLLWLLPGMIRRFPVGAALALGATLFSAVSFGLQHYQLADGQPYPYSLHYFELVDPVLCMGAALALRTAHQATERAGLRRAIVVCSLVLVASQLGLFAYGQRFVWPPPHSFFQVAWP